jgi:hypothetical protein
LLQVGFVEPGPVDVAAGHLQQIVSLLLLELAHDLAGRAEHEHAVRDLLAFRNQAVRADEGAAADARAVHDHAVDADQAAVADGAAVQHHLVPDAHGVAERHRIARVDVQHRGVLDVAALADRDAVVLGADHDLEPDAHLVVQRDIADQRGVVRDVVVFAEQLNAPLADGKKGHAAMIIE